MGWREVKGGSRWWLLLVVFSGEGGRVGSKKGTLTTVGREGEVAGQEGGSTGPGGHEVGGGEGGSWWQLLSGPGRREMEKRWKGMEGEEMESNSGGASPTTQPQQQPSGKGKWQEGREGSGKGRWGNAPLRGGGGQREGAPMPEARVGS